jgi:putative FmdB family regulatory protein
MPIIEYHCRKCGNVFENIEIDARQDEPVCPNCGSRNVEKIFSLFSTGKGRSACDISRPHG